MKIKNAKNVQMILNSFIEIMNTSAKKIPFKDNKENMRKK